MNILGSWWLSLLRFANRRTKNSRTLRRAGIWAYASLMRANRFLPPPRLLLNGPPKSGTHLLSDCLSCMPKMMFSGRHFPLPRFFSGVHSGNRPHHLDLYPALDRRGLTEFLEKCPQGMFVTTHAKFHPVFKTIIEQLQFKQILLLRDPRDVVVSHALYIKREPLHPQHGYYARLSSDEERVMESIRSLDEIFVSFLPWIDDPSILVVRFEDLIGPRGGGDSEKQLTSIRSVADFAERSLNQEQALQIARKMYGEGSPTFRKGQIGDWRNHFTDAHRRVFREVAGDTLVKLGYEKDTDW